MPRSREEKCEGCGLLTKKSRLFDKDGKWLCLQCEPKPTGPAASTPADQAWRKRKEKESEPKCPVCELPAEPNDNETGVGWCSNPFHVRKPNAS